MGDERFTDLPGVKLAWGAHEGKNELTGLNMGQESATGKLELGRGYWKDRCRRELQREREEKKWRRRISGKELTLRGESVGSKQE